MQIVIAWKDQGQEFVKSIYVGGGNYRNIFRDVDVPHACTWILDGTDEDLVKAQAYVAKEYNGLAFSFDDDDSIDILAESRRMILKAESK